MDDATFDAILADINAGTAVRVSIRTHGVHTQAFYQRLDADAEAAKRYARAIDAAMDAVADEAMDIADKCPADKDAVAKARLQTDLRKWWLAKRASKKYGDRTVIAGDPDAPLEHRHTNAAIEGKLFPEFAATDPPPALGKPDRK